MNKYRIKNHIFYYSWVYLLIIVFSYLLWSIIYQATEYKIPQNKQIEIYVSNSPMFKVDEFNADMEELVSSGFLGQEEIKALPLLSGDQNNYALDMQLNTFILASQGDIYILDKDRFYSYAKIDAFVDIDPQKLGIEINDSYSAYVEIMQDEKSIKKLCGIKAKDLKFLTSYGIPEDNYVAILSNGENVNNALELLYYMSKEVEN